MLITIYTVIAVISTVTANGELEKPRTFHATFGYNFNGRYEIPCDASADLEIDLAVTYKHGTLVVDDPVEMSGLAIFNSSAFPSYIDKVVHVLMYFDNARAYENQGQQPNLEGITQGIELDLFPTENSSRLTGNATMMWTIEGTYYPYLAFDFTNETTIAVSGVVNYPIGRCTQFGITVYPKYQYAQIVSSETSVAFTIAIYALTVMGTLNIVYYLWDWKPSIKNQDNQRNNANNNPEQSTDTENKTVNPKEGVKQDTK